MSEPKQTDEELKADPGDLKDPTVGNRVGPANYPYPDTSTRHEGARNHHHPSPRVDLADPGVGSQDPGLKFRVPEIWVPGFQVPGIPLL